MLPQPTLTTEHLILRPFTLADAPDVQRLAGDHEIAATTLRIPHPYLDGMAEEFLGGLEAARARGERLAYAITRREDGVLLGAIGLELVAEHERAELGYWIGKQYWGNGYCTEAARAVVRYGFTELKLNRIEAHHFGMNTASGRVMRNTGMKYEGHLVQSIKKWARFEDRIIYGLVRSQWEAGERGA